MKIDKAAVLAALRSKGQDARADFVDRQLPDVIDSDANAGLLRTLGLEPAELAVAVVPEVVASGQG